ncbi:MAG: PAS domain S-box protein [Bacteroidales bacterium]|nr:PAS domain S-box protein [Bacteroidales bacterium]
MLFDQTLQEIRRELAQIQLKKVANEEYLALLSSHTASLIALLEQVRASGDAEGLQADAAAQVDEILGLVQGFHFRIDSKMKIRHISPSVMEELGFSGNELLNNSFSQLIPDDSREAISQIEAYITGNDGLKSKLHLELELNDKKGNSIFYKLSLRRSGEAGMWSGFCLNIHELKLREANLIVERNSAELNDKLKSDFLANMSHEIRTPLNGIVGFSTMLGMDNITSEKKQKYVRIIRSSTKHLLTLVNDIIDQSKIEAGQLRIHCHELNVNLMLEELLATTVAEGQRLERNKLRIVKQVPNSGNDLIICTDEIRLKQVMNNLLGNALKFTHEGSIVFGYSLDGDERIRFFVRDSGVGISPTVKNVIFKRYKQTDEGRKKEYDGTGLGLAISKGIVELMGGKIGVLSEPGKGAEFYFSIPMTKNKH